MILSCLCKYRKYKSHLDDLRKSEDDIKWKNLAPRERMRLKKMQQADREAKRLSEVARVQLIENQQRKTRIHDTINKQSVSLPSILICFKAAFLLLGQF